MRRTPPTSLEVSFDDGGNVKRTTAQLNLHRASIHNRLRRIGEVAQVDLSNGDDRLVLDFGLKGAWLIELR